MKQAIIVSTEDQHWRKSGVIARHWVPYKENQVECRLCPRHCRPRNGQFGFNRVRGTVDGKLYTFNYGKSVAATEELIETEAVNHYAPGARILSLGNVGCMMSCDFCQNWETSQVKHLNPSVVKYYTPEDIVKSCIDSGIGIISWTYNDPVVWHEFVVDTSILAKKQGIKTLYKSAFYIEQEPVKELIECIDIFSISLKSMSEDFYRKFTKAELGPVLERIKQVHASGRHLEISQLVITDRNDNRVDIGKTIDWVYENLGPDIPLHFVAFHPAYKYTEVARTSPEILYQGRRLAKKKGIKHCYLGNLFDENAANTFCTKCGHKLVERFGLKASVVGINKDNCCENCGTPTSIKYPFDGIKKLQEPDDFNVIRKTIFHWNVEANSLHVELTGSATQKVYLKVSSSSRKNAYYMLGKGISRIIISRDSDSEQQINLGWNADVALKFYPVLDRAHFPVLEDLDTSLKGIKSRKK
ncbi:AmmeMemoRadiSam system radical SAM enzyme [Candidatus Sororendozoicomonas aggregata]|uniref:AmmeMemoRadiSam system radical SAM enzyme n=1 Tax=Candidatus Sororendozoicomonas aggregata TaxID=3073239 RepID=UPI002ED422E1